MKKNKNYFKKGHIPWNKELKGIHLNPETEWKKGQKGRNWMPIKSITIRKCKNGEFRRFIKIREPNKWLEYARFLWQKCYGTIPKGYIIHHKDNNALNDVLKNLKMITRKEHINIHRKIAQERIKNTIIPKREEEK